MTSCEGDGESQASEDEDSEQMCGILGVDVVWDCGETSAGVGPLLGGKQGLARWVEAGLEACFKVGMVCVNCPVLPSSMVGWAVAGRLGWALWARQTCALASRWLLLMLQVIRSRTLPIFSNSWIVHCTVLPKLADT